ncbi:MAG: ATP-dependent Clp protease adapter ClpS [Arenimonas sp.]|jgi:ATP-dependent Clp protease adaptor protein ClpS|uniref:ATP-dependent Clp protease adapter ClpS n=1 Tax=Arenimonas sp. TaxID=1872635 RepID=UPI003BFDADE6
MSGNKTPDQRDSGEALLEAVRAEVGPPGRFQVVLLNDDFTPMDFVVFVLQEFFAMNQEKATQVMLQIHTRGRGTGGVYSREVAESKVNQVNEFSRQNHHPLLSMMEPL